LPVQQVGRDSNDEVHVGDTRTVFEGDGEKRFGGAAGNPHCLPTAKVRKKRPLAWPLGLCFHLNVPKNAIVTKKKNIFALYGYDLTFRPLGHNVNL
jgi:hypothetical protein